MVITVYVICVELLYVSLSKDERVHFTEHTKWIAQQYPPARYDNTNVKLVKPKTYAAKIDKLAPDSKATSTWVIPKESSPGPGSYNTPEAIKLQLWGKVKG